MINATQIAADMAAGTPGPWHVWDEKPDGFTITHENLSPGAMTLNMIKVFARQTWRDEGHANARRIARLPELETAYLALTARVAELEGALWDIIPMTDEISRAPITAERWADRIEERARAALGEAKP